MKWHTVTSIDLQLYLKCHNWVLCPKTRVKTCVKCMPVLCKKAKTLIKQGFGGHLGNDVITKKALVTRFYFLSKLLPKGVPYLKTWCLGLNIFFSLKAISGPVCLGGWLPVGRKLS